MNWGELIGFVMVVAALALSGLAIPGWWSKRNRQPDATEKPEGIEARLARRVERDEAMWRRTVFRISWLLFLFGITVVWLSHRSVPPIPNTTASGGSAENGAQLQSLIAPSAFWSLFGIAGLVVAAGAVLVLFGKDKLARAAGIGSMAIALTAHGYLIKELKIGELLKIENKFDGPQFEANFNSQLRKLGGFGPEHLARLEGFDLGKSALKSQMLSELQKVCKAWNDHRTNQGLLMVIGATDRVALSDRTKLQYESNFGLARARAEIVKSGIAECGVPAPQVLALVSGPRNTPEVRERKGYEAGYADDRRVDVWAFWSLPATEEKPSKSIQVKIGDATKNK